MTEDDAPKDWIEGARAVELFPWKWSVETLNAAQKWAGPHGLRLLVTSENDKDPKEFNLVLYAAPKPIRSSTGLNEYTVGVRDKNLELFRTWFDGYLAGAELEPSRCDHGL